MSAAAPSDHFDGAHFRNPEGPDGPRSVLPILRWRLTGDRARWPDRVADPPEAPPPAEVPPGAASLSFIGHSSFLLRLRAPGGAVVHVLTDPIFSERCSPVGWAGPRRARAPGLALDALPGVELVLVSHNHYDHMDLPSLRALHRRFRPHFVTLAGNAAALRRGGVPDATELDWWDTAEAAGLAVTATPARHFAARTPWDRNRALWGGLMVQGAEGRVLFAGDSGAGGHWAAIRARLGAPDLALLPIGAYEPRWLMRPVHMDPAEALEARAALGARRAVGMHFGTFQLTDEAIDAPVRALDAARDQAGLPRDAFDVLRFGETRAVPLG